MDDDKPGGTTDDTPPLPPRGKRKRPGPTIELTATDVSADKTPADNISADKSSIDEKPSPRRERMKGFSPSSFNWPSFKRPSWSRPSFGMGVGSLLAAALTSAVVAAVIAAGVLLMSRPGAPAGNSNASSDSALIDALRVRIAALESQREQPAQATSPDSALSEKIDGIEKSLASLRGDIGKLREQGDSAAASIAALKSASQDSLAAADTSALEDRLTKLERATVALTADAPAHPAPAVPADPTVPRVAAAALLDQIVNRAEPYEAALSNARKFGDTGALKALEPFAATGVPTAGALSHELLALLPQLAPKPDTAPATGGILQRLQQSALKLVRVRRIDDAQSGDLIARVKDAAQREDIAEAKRLLMTLPDTDRAPVQPWIDKADARDAALKAARRYALDAMSVMPRPADSQ